MALAQALYEGVALGDGGRTGLITYPRTEGAWISPQAEAWGRALLAERPPGVAPPASPPAAGHEALRPTSPEWPPERVREGLRAGGGGRDLARLYALIWDRFLESRRSLAGWRALPAGPGAAAPEPARLGDASLLALLASHGVGRPSTFATIGQSLVARGYLARRGEGLSLTPLGGRAVAWLDRTFPRTIDAAFSAALERRLDEVEAGRVGWRTAVAEAWYPLEPVLGGASGLTLRAGC
jgi:DNA topoisomerase-1